MEETSPYDDIEWWVEINKSQPNILNYKQILLILRNIDKEDGRMEALMNILDKRKIKYVYDSWA